MVEHTLQLDNIFHSLADGTRRSILERVARQSLSVRQIAKDYNLTYAAVSKHLKVLEKSRLVTKRKEGKNQMVALAPHALKSADEYLEQYRRMAQSRFDKLEKLLNEKE